MNESVLDLNDTDLVSGYRENVEKFLAEQSKDLLEQNIEERDRLNFLLSEFMAEIVKRNIQLWMTADNNLSIPLFDNKNLLVPMFIKSKRCIVDAFKEEIIESSNKQICFEKLFLKKFKAVLTPSYPNTWQQIEFTDQKNKTIFLLTWL